MDDSQIGSFGAELKRRRVVKVAIAYAGASWALLDGAERLLDLFGMSGPLYRALLIATVAGFPVVLVLSWLFDLTSKGIERTPNTGGEGGPEGLSPRFTRQLVVSGAVVILAMTGVGWRYMPSDRVQLVSNQIAVLAFENRTGDPELDNLGLIVQDHIVEGLGYFDAFRAIAANPPMPGTAGPPNSGQDDPELALVQAVAENTRSALVITGSYFRSGDDVTFQARVQDAERDEVAFSAEPVRADPNDPMAGLGRLREGLLGYFGMLGDRDREAESMNRSRRLATRHAPSYAAYKEYALGIREFGASDWRASAERFELAASLDSTFFGALWRASTARMNMGDPAGTERLVERMEAMRSELVEGELVGVDWARGVVDGDLVKTHDAMVRGAELIPTSPILYLAGMAANAVNRPEETVEHFGSYDFKRWGSRNWAWLLFADARHRLGQHRRELWLVRKGREALPEDPGMLAGELRALAARGRDEEVEERIGDLGFPGGPWYSPGELCQGVVQELEAHGSPETAQRLYARFLDQLDGLSVEEQQDPRIQFLRTRVLAALDRNAEAQAVLDGLLQSDPESMTYRRWSAVLAARSGDIEYAEETIAWLGALENPYQRGSNVLEQARVAAALNDAERAVRFLETAFEQGSQDFTGLHVDPVFRDIRDHPTFVAFMEPRG